MRNFIFLFFLLMNILTPVMAYARNGPAIISLLVFWVPLTIIVTSFIVGAYIISWCIIYLVTPREKRDELSKRRHVYAAASTACLATAAIFSLRYL